MNENIIEIKGLSKVYNIYDYPFDRLKEALDKNGRVYHKEFYALKDISLTVKKGEILGLVGRNGAGKSTLLKLITGILEPTSGSVQANGTISALLELGTGFNPEYTGIQNIYLYGTMLGKTREEIDAELDNIISFANIGEFIQQPVKSYSSGMFARLAFSVAVNVKPNILIVDEILAVGDLDFQLKCMDRMKEMMRGGTTVLFVSHDINAVKRFCTRAVWIKNGVLMEDGDIDIVTDNYLDDLRVTEVKKPDVVMNADNIDENKESVEIKEGMKVEILSFEVNDSRSRNVAMFSKDEPITVRVKYQVYDTTVKNPVLGIAIRGMDDEYLCGVATSLDREMIPWEKGVNEVELEYSMGLLLIGGSYYFDLGFFDETGTVNIIYIRKISEFKIYDRYNAEGRFVIPHSWRGITTTEKE